MAAFRGLRPTVPFVRPRDPWLRSLLERLDDLEASDLFGELETELAR